MFHNKGIFHTLRCCYELVLLFHREHLLEESIKEKYQTIVNKSGMDAMAIDCTTEPNEWSSENLLSESELISTSLNEESFELVLFLL